MTSARKRSKLVRLVYGIVAKELPGCTIERDPLHRRYPDTNYGIYVYSDTEQDLAKLTEAIKNSFKERNLYVTIDKLRPSSYGLRKPGIHIWPADSKWVDKPF